MVASLQERTGAKKDEKTGLWKGRPKAVALCALSDILHRISPSAAVWPSRTTSHQAKPNGTLRSMLSSALDVFAVEFRCSDS